MGETLQTTPAQHLEMLMARAQNPFDISDSVLARLDEAVLCQVEVHGLRHRSAPPSLRWCSYRHTFLLADGTSLTLWELRHETGSDGGESRFEIYEREEALRVSQRRARGLPPLSPLSGPAGPESPSGPVESAGPAVPAVDPHGRPAEAAPAPSPTDGDREWDRDTHGIADDRSDPLGRGFVDLLAAGAARIRPYAQGDSPDHARRLLRRAENTDRPGAETRRLLSTALRHDIVHVPRVCSRTPAPPVWCSLYEHAFLLADGREVSLYELEHNLAPGGRLVCEVYPDQAAAEGAARRHARERGIDL